MAGSCSGINNGGRCLTTAIALAYGPLRGPAVVLLLSRLQLLSEYGGTPSTPKDQVRLGWAELRNRLLIDGKPKWSRVTGIMGATICSLADLGWSPLRADIWLDVAGKTWIMAEGPLTALLDSIRASAVAKLWREAAKHRHMRGAGFSGDGIAGWG